ncbi:MAG: DUF2071 domain-containing protein [Phycisphaeraceae bacterium]|nr:DUF2071 domain-containing protein [Phycisphaeraceae bacterium]
MPVPRGVDVRTMLAHFAIITYAVDPDVLQSHIHPRFTVDRITLDDGSERGLVSVVPFLDTDFRFACFPWKTWTFGQTNYRAYVTDTQTGEHVVWFFGTTLGTIYNAVPKHRWKLPWHRGRIVFDCAYDEPHHRFSRYAMKTESTWAPADVTLKDTGTVVTQDACVFEGFDDFETGFRVLTHPMKGYFTRRDGRLGTYSIWHDRLTPTVGTVERASFPLLDRLGLVRDGDTSTIHSVLMQREVEFIIHLPPKRA